MSFIQNSNIENSEVTEIISKSILINQVTNIEVYCKDMLDAFFKMCAPNFTKQSLKEIHKDKYDIDDLIYLYENSVHPIELISFNQSFQSLATINQIFSKILKIKVFEEMKTNKFRIKGETQEFSFDDKEIYSQTELLFKTRHELVHNPSNETKLEIQTIQKMINYSATFIHALDLVLSINFEKNK